MNKTEDYYAFVPVWPKHNTQEGLNSCSTPLSCTFVLLLAGPCLAAPRWPLLPCCCRPLLLPSSIFYPAAAAPTTGVSFRCCSSSSFGPNLLKLVEMHRFVEPMIQIAWNFLRLVKHIWMIYCNFFNFFWAVLVLSTKFESILTAGSWSDGTHLGKVTMRLCLVKSPDPCPYRQKAVAFRG